MATFDSLPPELLILIQRMVDSPPDLHSLITASPACLRAFSLDRVRILSSVVVNGIQPGALRHAVAIFHAPPPAETRPRQPLELFLDRYFSDTPLDLPTDTPDLATLCRLQALVSRFANEYFESAIRLLRTTKSSIPLSSYRRDDIAPLSHSELTRLQRAFFRHELYCRLFPVDQEWYSTRSFPTSDDQFRLFIARLEPWEVEEVNCVHDYLMRVSRHAVEDLEDRVVQAVLSFPGVQRPSECRLSAPGSPKVVFKNQSEVMLARRCELGENISTDPAPYEPTATNTGVSHRCHWSNEWWPACCRERLLPFDDLEFWGLDIFEKTRRRSMASDVSNLAALGLGAISRLVDGDGELRRNMIQEHVSYPTHFLGEALRHSPSHHVDPDLLRICGEGPGSDDPAQASVGYRLFRRPGRRLYDQIQGHVGDFAYNPLRERGYVFWDSARIEVGGATVSLEEARDVPRETLNSMIWRRRMSVEERLEGVMMPGSVKERITREFGYPKWFDSVPEGDE